MKQAVTVISILFVLLLANGAFGEGVIGWARDMNWGSYWSKMDEPIVPETIQGEVVNVMATPLLEVSPGVQFLVRTGDEVVSVHLGPYGSLDNPDFEIDVNDHVEVTGSWISFKGEAALIAREVMIWRYLEAPLHF
jgi:hypothetical protein